MVELVKDAVRQTVGIMPLYDLRLRVLRAPRTARLALVERAEVRSIRRALPRRPAALVATVIPTHRRPAQLLRAIESALEQTVRDHVVVVVDDGGGLPALPSHERLVAVSLTRKSGAAGVARNVGIGISRSRYLAFLDDDNEWLPNHLEVSLAAHEAGAELTYTAMVRQRPDGTELDVLSVPFDRAGMRNLARYVDTSTVVVRRLPGVRFSRVPRGPDDFPMEDWELAFRLSRRMRTQHVPVQTVRYLVNPASYNTNWTLGRR